MKQNPPSSYFELSSFDYLSKLNKKKKKKIKEFLNKHKADILLNTTHFEKWTKPKLTNKFYSDYKTVTVLLPYTLDLLFQNFIKEIQKEQTYESKNKTFSLKQTIKNSNR